MSDNTEYAIDILLKKISRLEELAMVLAGMCVFLTTDMDAPSKEVQHESFHVIQDFLLAVQAERDMAEQLRGDHRN